MKGRTTSAIPCLMDPVIHSLAQFEEAYGCCPSELFGEVTSFEARPPSIIRNSHQRPYETIGLLHEKNVRDKSPARESLWRRCCNEQGVCTYVNCIADHDDCNSGRIFLHVILSAQQIFIREVLHCEGCVRHSRINGLS